MRTTTLIAMMTLATVLTGCGRDDQADGLRVPEDANVDRVDRYKAELYMTTTRASGTNHLTVSLMPGTISATKEVLNSEDKALVAPTFLRHEAGKDVYRIERRYPLGADSESVAAKEIAFDGKVPVIVFDDSFLTVVLQARGNSEQSDRTRLR